MDRKARRALIALVLVVIATLIFAVRSLVESSTPPELVADSNAGSDQILVLGNQTMFLQRGTVGSEIAQWLNSGAGRPKGFVIDDQAFVAGSADLTPEASVRVDRLVNVMKSDENLHARLLITTYEGADAKQRLQLARKRSEAIRSEMIERGVSSNRVATAVLPLSKRGARRPDAQPTILILLSRRTRAT